MRNNFATAGCRRISRRHAEHISIVGKVKAVRDIIPESSNSLAGQYGATAYYSLEQMLTAEKDIDIISICIKRATCPKHW